MKANGWPVKKISEIAKHSLGKMLDKNKNKGTPRPYLRNLNVRWFEFDLSDVLEMRFLDEEEPKFTAIKGDVLICEGGYPGRAAIWDRDEPIHFQKAIHRVRFYEPERNKWFVYYLHYLEQTDKLKEYCSGTGILHFTGKALARLPMPLPPLPEQRRIVGILDEAFAAIATAKANTEKNLQNAREVFESELGDVFAKDWDTRTLVTLSDLATEITDGDHLPPPKSATGLPFITIGNINKSTRTIDFSDTFTVPRSYFDGLNPNRRPRGGDVLYTVTGSFGIPVIVEDDREFCFQRHIALVRPNRGTETRWLYYLLLSPQVMAQAEAKATGTAQRTVSLKVLRSYTVPLVPFREQGRIVVKLDRISTETQRLVTLHRQKLAALDALKKSLLHQAFSGRLGGGKTAQVLEGAEA